MRNSLAEKSSSKGLCQKGTHPAARWFQEGSSHGMPSAPPPAPPPERNSSPKRPRRPLVSQQQTARLSGVWAAGPPSRGSLERFWTSALQPSRQPRSWERQVSPAPQRPRVRSAQGLHRSALRPHHTLSGGLLVFCPNAVLCE